MDETYLPLAPRHGDVDEAAGVCDALLGAALGRLLLLLGLDLGGLRLHFAGTRERAVDFPHDCGLVFGLLWYVGFLVVRMFLWRT